MQKIEYRTQDKSDWPEGPWKYEPDKIQWLDEETQLPCLIVRGPHGGWCGYVGVSKNHPAYKKHYDAVDVEVHGGLTFSNLCAHGDEKEAICHLVEPGEDDNVWWLGFDCAHAGDWSPKYSSVEWLKGGPLPYMQEEYRDQAYVTAEVLQLAKQLKELA